MFDNKLDIERKTTVELGVISKWITPDAQALADEITSIINKQPDSDVLGHTTFVNLNKGAISIRDLVEVLKEVCSVTELDALFFATFHSNK